MAEQRTDLPYVRIPGEIYLGSDVRLQGIQSELLMGLLIVASMCIRQGVTMVITHILDGHHMKNSLHYVGAAADFTLSLVVGRKAFVIVLRDSLGKEFDVIDEGDHIHIEYQPHHAAVT